MAMEKVDLELMKKVASILGYRVEMPEEARDSWRCFLKQDPDRELFLNCTWGKAGKYYLSGSYPRNGRGEVVTPYVEREKIRGDGSRYMGWEEIPNPKISFDPKKGAEKVAADIRRRFLPDYETRLAAVKAKIMEQDKYYSGMDSGLARICAVLGEKVPESKDRVYIGKFGSGWIGEIRIQGSGSEVRMDLECSLENAVRIFELLKKEDSGADKSKKG
jgi:hypothetical protein